MIYLSGLLIAFLSIIFSIVELRQNASSYFDIVGFLVVTGGTIAVAIITLPWDMAREVTTTIKQLFGKSVLNRKAVVIESFELIRSIQAGVREYRSAAPSIIGQTMTDGTELIALGFDHSKIHSILSERIYQWGERKQRVANSIRSLAKYPPAFGLVGTVLGLVSLMRSISDGASSSEAGVRMAVALVATLYGLLTANLILNPAGENILKSVNEEKKAAEIALEAILMAAQGVNLLEAQEVLNSHVGPDDRINILGSAATSDDSAEGSAAA